ncbi:uncharacterized protein PG986_003099 [Apiospora aurea]|uniref:Uncharacterized protein n=1 Tax=Apiospora aurea TaxID=335848 RepID=A0ABR1QQQ1_9PEZI
MVANRELDSTTTMTTYYSTIVVGTNSSTSSEATQSSGLSSSSIPTTPVVLTRTTVLTLGSSTGTTSSPSTTAPNNETNGHRNQAWTAGPVLGSLAGAALILTTAILLSRRRRKANGQHDWGSDAADKPQLHSDCIPKPLPTELDDSEMRPPIELPETRVTGGLHELPDLRNPLSADVAGQASELEAPITAANP